MKRILITGSNGFLGQELVKKLKKLNYCVFEFSRKNKKDILQKKSFDKFKNIDTVFHLAAVVGYVNVAKNIELAYKTNVLGTINVLEFCQRQKAKLLFPSTFVYGSPFDKKKKETDSVDPANFYTYSKYLGELYCRLFAEKYQVDTVIARTANAYGPNQPKQYIIPLLIESFKKGKKLVLTDADAKRDYLFIDDLASAYIALAKTKTKRGEIFNVSSGKSTSLKNLVDIIRKITNSDIKIRYRKRLRKNEVSQSLFDNSKILEKTNWKPEYSLERGLRETVKKEKKIYGQWVMNHR